MISLPTLEDLGVADEISSSLSAEHMARVVSTLDSPRTFNDGDALPILWHWTHFLPTTATNGLGTDGHPMLAGEVSEIFSRRMWASGSLHASGHLLLGEPATRCTSLRRVRETEGRTGPLLIVDLEHRYRQFGVDQLREIQTLVYRTPGASEPLPIEGWKLPEGGEKEWNERYVIGPVMLFRFSALTFNSHRIHYDEPYATSVEGYPRLVVHGPLSAMLAGESIRRHTHRELVALEFRANAALFADQPITIFGKDDGDNASATVARCDGTEAMRLTATLGDRLSCDV